MAVLTNTMMQGTAAFEEDTGFKIENSLRFEDDEKSHLQAGTTPNGCTTTWTFATWLKRNGFDNIGAAEKIFSACSGGSNMSQLELSTANTINFQTITGGSIVAAVGTGDQNFRDISAWYHICVAYDSTDPEASERLKLWINGKPIATTQNNAIELNQASHVNNSTLTLGGSPIGDAGHYGRYQLSDVYLIEGRALSPAAFGSIDSLGIYNPKAFALPTPNTGVTWSGMITGSVHAASSATYAFDGLSTTQAQPANGNELTFTPTDGLDFTTFELEYALCTESGYPGPTPWIKVNDVNISEDLITNDGSGSNCHSNYHASIDLRGKYGITKINTIKWTRNSDGDMLNIQRILIDGITLVDGQTDPETWDRKWYEYFSTSKVLLDCTASSCDDISDNNYSTTDSGSPTYQVTAPTNSLGITKAIQLDGQDDYIVPANVNLGISASTETTIDVSFYLDSTHNIAEGYIYDFRSTGDGYCMYMWASNKLGIIGASGSYGEITSVTEDTWHHLRIQSDKVWYDGTLTGLTPGKTAIGSSFPMGKRYQAWSGNLYYFKGLIGAFRILPYKLDVAPPAGGEVCVNGVFKKEPSKEHTEANSFYLNFKDKSSLGKDTLNGALADATGGLPIYNTSGDSGDVKGSGYRADSSAGTTNDTGLVLAVPGDSVASGTCDVHQAINTGSSNKAFTNGGTYTVSTDKSRFYGSSLKSTGTQYGSFAHDDDFHFGSGNFTIECWAYCTNNALGTSDGIIANWDSSGNDRSWMLCQTDNEKFGFMWSTNGSSGTLLEADKVLINSWHHIAAVRNSNTISLYIDGVLNASASESGTLHDNDGAVFLGKEAQSSWGTFEGYINDLRVYKGVAKYTAAFSAPNRNDFSTVNGLITSSGVTVKDASNNNISEDYSDDCTGGAASGDNHKSVAFTYEQVASKAWYAGSTGQTLKWEPTTHIPAGSTGHSGYIWVKGGDGNGQGFAHGSIVVTVKINDTTVTTDSTEAGYQAWYRFAIPSNATFEKIEFVGNYPLVYAFSFTDAEGTGLLAGGTALESTGVRLVDGTTFLNGAAAVDIDTSLDSPTSYGSGTSIRSNYCTLNPLIERWSNGGTNGVMRKGNLRYNYNTGNTAYVFGTQPIPTTGKWYFEMTYDSGTAAQLNVGLLPQDMQWNGYGYMMFRKDGNKLERNVGGSETASAYGSAWAVGNVIGCAVDQDNKAIYWSINGTWQASGDPTSGASRTNAAFTDKAVTDWLPGGFGDTDNLVTFNFGQQPFNTNPPSGYKTLCTRNLPDTFSGDEVNDPSKYFGILTYNGTGTTAQNVLGLKFQPDLVWIKNRDGTNAHHLYDAIRGKTKRLFPDINNAEATDAPDAFDFKSTGIEVDEAVTDATNNEDDSFVAWNWDCGTAAVTPSSSYDITPDAQWVNATAGFSITKYTGNGTADQRIPHGQAVKPDFAIIKKLSSAGTAGSWMVKHVGLNANQVVQLEDNAAQTSDSSWWGVFKDHPDQVTVKVSTHGSGSHHTIQDEQEYILYTWSSIPGYSKFGSYEGTGNAGTASFVYTGFRPRWLLTKDADASGAWAILDTVRDKDGNGPDGKAYTLQASWNGAEDNTSTDINVDIYSNGFRPRTTWNPVNGTDGSGGNGTMIYCAFAEHPFKIARAR